MLDKVLRLVCTAAAVFLVTLVDWLGISFGPGTSTWQKVLTALVMALVLGVVNTFLKPLIKLIGLPFYLLTLGLISLVVNGFLFWLCGVIVRAAFDLQFNVPFWPGAILGALFVTVVTVVLGWVIKDYRK